MTDSATNDEEAEVEEAILGVEGDRSEADSADILDQSDEPERIDADSNEVTSDAVAEAPTEADEAEDAGAVAEELERLNDRHLRLASEFNNFRRRTEQERLSAWSRARADLVGEFVEVLDDLHRVAELDLTNATVESIMEGIDLVERKFVRVVEASGAEMMDPVGEAFDPELMEAMMRVPAESDDQIDTVAQVFQKGYSLKGILVRPARVSVYTKG